MGWHNDLWVGPGIDLLLHDVVNLEIEQIISRRQVKDVFRAAGLGSWAMFLKGLFQFPSTRSKDATRARGSWHRY